MLSPNTLLIERSAPLGPCILVLDGDALDAMHGSLSFASALYGAGSVQYRDALAINTVRGALRAWAMATSEDAETLALDDTQEPAIRALAAALCLGVALPLSAPAGRSCVDPTSSGGYQPPDYDTGERLTKGCTWMPGGAP